MQVHSAYMHGHAFYGLAYSMYMHVLVYTEPIGCSSFLMYIVFVSTYIANYSKM